MLKTDAAHAYLKHHLESAVDKYIKLHTVGGVLTISSDAARELLPGYSTPAERTSNNFALGPASSKLAASVWERAMDGGPTDQRYIVEFLTGSPGSGKTSSFIGKEDSVPAAIISEGMMDDLQKSTERIQQSIDRGFVPVLRLVYVDDPRTTVRRAVSRAMKHGRPVSIAQMGRLYVEIPKTVAELNKRFGAGVGIDVTDNSVDGRPPVRSTIARALHAARAYTINTAREAMRHELDQLRSSGRITEDLYRKFIGDDPRRPPEYAGSRGPDGPAG